MSQSVHATYSENYSSLVIGVCVLVGDERFQLGAVVSDDDFTIRL
jgi:hypothetical protein